MKVNFPANCNSESSRWSYSVKLLKVAMDAHNAEGKGTTLKWLTKLKVIGTAINEQVEIARKGEYWNSRIPDHASGGNINYPPELDQDNEGSRASFLFGVGEKLNLTGEGPRDINVRAVQEALSKAKRDAMKGIYWNPSLEDIL